MYIHLKSNLINKLEKKCYENYGFVDKIYNIEEISDGVIEPEDPSCSAKLEVKFSCNLFLPIVGKEIICKIDRMNKALIMGINGPIKVIISADKINKEKFFPDINRNIRVKGTSEVVVPGMYLRILVLSKSFGNYDRNILVIGFMQDIATQKEINNYMEKTDNSRDETFNLIEN
jgi:DNA-directed RNA polymerase subunit E'/Rpb7